MLRAVADLPDHIAASNDTGKSSFLLLSILLRMGIAFC
jgi:hypothetical protein